VDWPEARGVLHGEFTMMLELVSKGRKRVLRRAKNRSYRLKLLNWLKSK
jgi:hypothetical protein